MSDSVENFTKRSMRMNLHSLSKLGFMLTFIVFIGLFLISVIIGAAGPNVFGYTPHLEETSWITIDDTWVAQINVSKLNQRLLLVAVLENSVNPWDGRYYPKDRWINFNLTIRGTNKDDNEWKVLQKDVIAPRKVTCKEDKQWCGNQYFANMTVIHRPYIDYDRYEFKASVVNGANESRVFPHIIYRYQFLNSKFTLFELWFRFIFLVFSFVVIVLFAVKMKGYDWSDWTIEQKWVALLLFGLLGYNNPFFPLTILIQGWFPIFLDQTLLASFLVLLLLFWLVTFDGLRTEAAMQTFKSFYLPKIILIGTFWLFAIIIFTWSELKEINNPEQSLDANGWFVFCYIVMGAIVVIYTLWLLFVIFRAVSSRDTLPFLSLRLKFFGSFTLIVLLITIGGVLFGLIGPLSNNAAQLLSFLSLFNFYVFVLAFVYWPAKGDAVGIVGDTPGVVSMQKLDENVELDSPSPTSGRNANNVKINFGDTDVPQRYEGTDSEDDIK